MSNLLKRLIWFGIDLVGIILYDLLYNSVFTFYGKK